jgi:RHS repeat-associated protein
VGQTDSDGTPTYQAAYMAFGQYPVQSGSTLDRQRASTKEQDPTGLLNEGFRYRDPSTGTFLTRDPLGFKAGLNTYTYVRQNPWTHFDPEGLQTNDTSTLPPPTIPYNSKRPSAQPNNTPPSKQTTQQNQTPPPKSNAINSTSSPITNSQPSATLNAPRISLNKYSQNQEVAQFSKQLTLSNPPTSVPPASNPPATSARSVNDKKPMGPITNPYFGLGLGGSSFKGGSNLADYFEPSGKISSSNAHHVFDALRYHMQIDDSTLGSFWLGLRKNFDPPPNLELNSGVIKALTDPSTPQIRDFKVPTPEVGTSPRG